MVPKVDVPTAAFGHNYPSPWQPFLIGPKPIRAFRAVFHVNIDDVDAINLTRWYPDPRPVLRDPTPQHSVLKPTPSHRRFIGPTRKHPHTLKPHHHAPTYTSSPRERSERQKPMPSSPIIP